MDSNDDVKVNVTLQYFIIPVIEVPEPPVPAPTRQSSGFIVPVIEGTGDNPQVPIYVTKLMFLLYCDTKN